MKHYYFLLMGALAVISCKTDSRDTAANGTINDTLTIAKRIHKEAVTIDTHCDINVKNFTDSVNYTQNLDTQVTLPKMDTGGLDVAWFIVYTGQEELNQKGYDKAYENAISKFEAIHRLCEEIAPDKIALAYTANDVDSILKEGKKVAMIGIENGYPVGEDISRVKEFYEKGGRYMSLAHQGHSQLSDSNTGEENDEWLHNGLSELGKEVIKEMNYYGMMIDVSHPSKEAIRQMIELSKAPVIASHSSARGLNDHSRNLDDEQLEWISQNGGVVQTVAFSAYVDGKKHEAFQEKADEIYRNAASASGFEILSRDNARALPAEQRTEYYNRYMAIRTEAAPKIDSLRKVADPVDVSDFVDHIDYLVEKLGIDHVGISSDFDGGGGVYKWSDASETFNVTLELFRRGYTEEEIKKLWGENLMRVLREVENVARELQGQDS
ncbi:dipeptidase [Robertkochia aurantiaca]|uniref:dipeptidase n=1 Tax=Robertkochia aurantiaca TaxID=2873700 RepID=UPI001CCF9CC5|nr:dipeptidase [Robertkochia sp. 3YJGBD-33]